MPSLKWSPQAISDVQRLQRFLLSKSPEAATRAVQAIRRGVAFLRLQPAMGRLVDDLPEEFREWVIDFGDSGYVVRYRLDTAGVTLLNIRHQREVGY